MRKRYGYRAFGLLAALLVLCAASATWAQVLINPKYYPTLSIRNYHINSDGIIRVPQPGPGGDRYFLIPVYIYNEVDTTFNPNAGGQHLEPIRSFEFQMTYLTQAMVLDTQASHGSPIVMIGADPTAQPAVGKTFFTRYSDQLVIPPVQVPPITPNPYLHCVRVAGASEVPLPLTNTSDSGSVLCYLRFKVVVSAVNASLLQLDSSKFNDHVGDSLLNAPGSFFPYTHGNFGGGQGVGGSISKGGGLVQITPQPAFELRPFSQITTTDNTNFFLTLDMVYDPTLGGATPQRSVQITDAIGNTNLANVNICSDQNWLTLSLTQGGSAQQCVFIPSISYTSSFGSQQKDLWLNASGAAGLAPGIYYGTVTMTSDGAANSPVHLRVKLIVQRRPNEPSASAGTGIRLNITNNCTPTCTSTIAFGTGAGASSGIDPLYGERIFTKDDSVAHDTSSVAGAQCYAYFEPIDRSVDIAYQDPNFLGTVRDIRDTLSDTTLLYKVVFKPGNVNCYPVKVCVDPNDFPAGARIVVHFVLNGSDQGIDLRNATQDGSNRCFTINDHNRNYFYIEYTPGTIGILPTVTPNVWNLISLPVIPSDPNASVVLLNAATSPFEYRAAGLWQQPANNNLQFGRGYLVKYGAYTQGSNFVAGTRSCQATNIQIDGGWNTIGGTSFTAGINQIYFTPMPNNSTPPSLLTDVWEFVATKGYRTVAFIQPGKGYFIKVDTVGYYNLNSCNSTMAKNEISNKTAIQQEVEGLKGTLSSVTVSDARSNSQELFFGNSATSLRESHFEMPPAAPELDARFTNNSGYMSYNHDSYTVALRTANYPVSLNFANVQGSVVVSDLQGNVLGTSTNGSSVAVTNPQVKQVVISYKDGGSTNAALTLGLGQNFPNPANGVTTISYTVPTKMPVSLKVYNALGQVVKTLVEGEVAAGRYDAVLDTHEMTNGTYFYTLTAGDFTQTMRMVLTK